MTTEFTEIFHNLLDAIEQPVTQLAVAVSGGADSMALLHLAHIFAGQHKIKLTALTVDHGLRPESKAEAEAVSNWCQKNNIPHHVLQWQGTKPETGLQDAARQARRQLLCDKCHALDIPVLLLAHQADDQAETIIMRLQRGTGLRGILGIQEVVEDAATGVLLLRPLLSMRRAELRNYCTKNQIPFHDDPANDDPRFERARVRQALQSLPDFAAGLTQTLTRLRDCHETLDMLAAEWLEESIEPIDASSIWIPLEFTTELYPPVQLRVLEGALLEVLPEDTDVSDIPLDGLERLAEAVSQPNFKGQTLADVQIKPHTADGVKGLLLAKAPLRRSN
jgi:tRNA(Ile)-lysidine synthetase-like protein